MFRPNWIVRMSAVGFLLGASAAYAQQGAQDDKPKVEPRPAPARFAREVRGLVQSIDAKAGKITVQTRLGRGPEGNEATFHLAKDVEVAINDGAGRRGLFREAKLADLTEGIVVQLSLGPDSATVISVAAESPTARGQLKGVDAKARTLTLLVLPSRFARGERPMPEEKTLSLAPHAEIGVDDGTGRRFSIREAKLADLQLGSLVTAWLSLDQQQILGLLAEGPTQTGVLTAVDAGANTLTFRRAPGRDSSEAEELKVKLAPGAVTLLDDGSGRLLSVREGKLAELPVGAAITVRLTPDQKLASQVRAEGPQVPAMLRAVDADKRTITVAIRPANRGDEPEQKSWNVAANARIVVEGAESKLADLKPTEEGTFVMLRLSLDQKEVRSIQAGRGRR